MLAAPGKLVAQGTPVYLKSSLGEGYTLDVAFESHTVEKSSISPAAELLQRIRQLAPHTTFSSTSPGQGVYALKVKDTPTVQRVLQVVEDEKASFGVASYSILGTSIEDIFLGLMHDNNATDSEKEPDPADALPILAQPLELTIGRPRSPLSQALIIFHKRWLIFRRSWLTPLLAVGIAIAGSCIPVFFLKNTKDSCTAQHVLQDVEPVQLFGALSGLADIFPVLASPPGIISTLGPYTAQFQVENIPDNASFVDTIDRTFLNQSLGGVSFDLQNNGALFAWEATPPGLTGQAMLNLASNILYNNALNATGRAAGQPSLIAASYQSFIGIAGGTLSGLKWVAFFGASMVSNPSFMQCPSLSDPYQAVFPAFFSLYVSKERRSSVQAMQFSNGLNNPVGLWLGHLMFDAVFCVIAATLIIAILAGVASHHFHGLGFFVSVVLVINVVAKLTSAVARHSGSYWFNMASSGHCSLM